ncbi:MAG TPA: MFS transporter [Gaiellaceae bacterium]
MKLAGRLGALTERNFRLLFSSTTISALGDGVATIALAFAVLDVSHNSAVALGGVIAARQAAQASITLVAGVWADRLPRHVLLISVASIQGAAQATTAAVVLTGHATVPLLIGLQVVYGLADGFVLPASQGLIPATISRGRLQQANALLGLSRNTIGILGPALGGVLVGLGSPGSALLVDAASFGAAALLLTRLHLPARADVVEPKSFLADMREGWGYFRRQTWLWTTIVFFGIGNFAFSSYFVLGPLIAKRDLGGAPAWAALMASFGVGSVVGGLFALRFRPRRPLLASCMAAWPIVLQPVGIALLLPLPVLASFSAAAGFGIAVHLALWFTVFQREVPPEALSRVSSYDAFGSFVLGPLGAALAGPAAAAFGTETTLLGAAAVIGVTELIVFAQPSVWAIHAPDEAPAPAAA